MKAMVLAAGIGERLYPLTLSQAKPTIPVLGRPLALQLLRWLGDHGVDEVVLNLHHLPDTIRDLFAGGESGLPEVRFTFEEEILGTAGGLRNAAALLRGEGPIIVANADFLSDIDLRAVLDDHRNSDRAATLVLAPPRPNYSTVQIDAAGCVISLAGAPEVDASAVAGEFLFTGCHVIDEEVLDRIPDDGPRCLIRDVYRPLAARGRLGAFLHDGFWWEFGSPELYLEGTLLLLEQEAPILRSIARDHDVVRKLGDAVAAIGPGSEIDDHARFAGRVALGYASFVSAGCRIEDSVIMPEAWVGPDCRISHSVIGKGVELPAGFTAEDAMICSDSDPRRDLPASVRRVDDLLVYAFDR